MVMSVRRLKLVSLNVTLEKIGGLAHDLPAVHRDMSVFRWLCCCCRCGWLFGLGDARKWPWIYRKFPFIFQYKSIKYIKVDVAHVCLLHRFLQVAMMMLALFVPLYFNDAWALTETPGGTVNAWESPGMMEVATGDTTLASRTAYCSSALYSYSSGNYHLPSPDCLTLLPGELTQKSAASVFYTTSYMETVTRGWPCASDSANRTRETECRANGGQYFGRRNGQCGCVSQSAVYPLAVEEMTLSFEHAYDTSLLGRGSSALGKLLSTYDRVVGRDENTTFGDALTGGSSEEEEAAATEEGGEYNAEDDPGTYSIVSHTNGSSIRFEAGEPLELNVADWLSAANVSLDDPNEAVARDEAGNLPPLRTTGVTIAVDVEYSNRDRETGRVAIGATAVHADVKLKSQFATWTSAGKVTHWVQAPSSRRSAPSEYHLVERWRYGVKFQFNVTGSVYRLDFWVLLSVVLTAVIALQVANLAADGVAFYLLCGGQSTVLRNKRQELVSKRSEFAEIGMKAALAARVYRDFDPDNNGSIEPVDIVRAFANVRKSDGNPWVPVEKAHAIAHSILRDADTDGAGEEGSGGQYGLSFSEFMTCMEGDAINFDQFLKNAKLPKMPKGMEITDHEECRKAFEEERATLPPPTSDARRKADAKAVAKQAAQEAANAPPAKLDLPEAEASARLQRKGVLKLHLVCANGLKSTDANGLADPYVVVLLGKKEKKSSVQPTTLDPVWDEQIIFQKTPKLETVTANGIVLGLKDKDLLSDDLIGKCKVDLEPLTQQQTCHFYEQQVKPQGTITFSVTWEEEGVGGAVE